VIDNESNTKYAHSKQKHGWEICGTGEYAHLNRSSQRASVEFLWNLLIQKASCLVAVLTSSNAVD